jgi:hypothetical protein
MPRTVATRRVAWCNRSICWTAVSESDGAPSERNTYWCYQLDGLTYYSFAFDPTEAETTTRQRALNWLNSHHLIIRREHLAIEWQATSR